MLSRATLTLIAHTALSAWQRYRIIRLTRAVNNLADLNIQILKEFKSAEAQLQYLVHILNERGIELEEFDYIALPYIIKKVN